MRCSTPATAKHYELNLIDTPGHVDFHYEVSRSLACCEGAMLVVDAAQGVEAQTLANAFAAMNSGLHIVPVINKIDLHQRPHRRSAARDGAFARRSIPAKCSRCSAKAGLGIEELLDAVIDRVPPPSGDPDGVLAGDGVRFALRRLPRRDHLCPRHERHASSTGRRSASSATATTHEVVDLGQFVPGPAAVRFAAQRARSAT